MLSLRTLLKIRNAFDYCCPFKVCRMQRDGYWTYELCPFKSVRQFHMDDTSSSATDFSLGTFSEHHLSSPTSGVSPRTYVQVAA